MALNRSDLIAAVAERVGCPQSESKALFEAIEGVILDAVRDGQEVRWTDLLKLRVEHKPAREARNPANGQTVQVAAKNVVKLSTFTKLDEAARAASLPVG